MSITYIGLTRSPGFRRKIIYTGDKARDTAMDNVAAGTKQGISDSRSRLHRELDHSIEQVGSLRGTLEFIEREVKYFEQSRRAPEKNLEAIGRACAYAKAKHKEYRQAMGWDTEGEK